jgi:hypothetical protein
VLAAFVRNPAAGRQPSREPNANAGWSALLGLLRDRKLSPLLLSAGLLGALTISDGMLFLMLQRRLRARSPLADAARLFLAGVLEPGTRYQAQPAGPVCPIAEGQCSCLGARRGQSPLRRSPMFSRSWERAHLARNVLFSRAEEEFDAVLAGRPLDLCRVRAGGAARGESAEPRVSRLAKPARLRSVGRQGWGVAAVFCAATSSTRRERNGRLCTTPYTSVWKA